jgi:FKBP-type peptidyl-prolyl cis-trans isomerase FklB
MKAWSYLWVTAAAAVTLRAQENAYKPDLSNHNQKINYAMGQDIVTTFGRQDVEIDMKAFMAGMADALAGDPQLSDEEKKAALKDMAQVMEEKGKAKLKVIGAENLKKGEAFLAGNATKPGVRKMQARALDGSTWEMQYIVLKSGTGESPKEGDTIEMHYVSSLIDGTVFDSSRARGTPVTFNLKQVMPGLAAALRVMKVGDKWRLFIPPKLGFGEFGPPQIGPDSTVIYEVEMLSFFTPKEKPVAAAASPAGN